MPARMRRSLWRSRTLVFAIALLGAYGGVPAQESELPVLGTVEVLGTAENAWKQAPGVSTVTRDDLDARPTNDLADLVRKEPGVNLTGNSTSGQRGNNRQIDLRGMGPENTLILIDGRPVTSRNSIRYGWRGERDTRGDMNWVPPDAIEQIEILRGPAAARYGNGAAGGVVNIITRGITDKPSGSATAYLDQPEDSRDGAVRRAGFSLAAPISDLAGFRLSGNLAKTGADAWDINQGHASTRTGAFAGTFPAGREGVRDRDLSGRLTLQPAAGQTIDFDVSFARQGNIYAGDTQNTNNFTVDANGNLVATSQRVRDALGTETNRMYRSAYALTHKGRYDSGTSMSYLQYELTRNVRMDEGLAGGTEGLFSSDRYRTARLRSLTAHAEYSAPGQWGNLAHVMTAGAEWVEQRLDDANSTTQTTSEAGSVPGIADIGRSSRISARIASAFLEDNIEITPATVLTPGLRLDHHSAAGTNWSPAINLSHYLEHGITIKAGAARAYKAPNLYQINPDYLLYSRGNGCWGAGGSCYLQGNADLKAETSINKELGVEYASDTLLAGLTIFHNAYRNKIDAGTSVAGQASGGSGAYANADVFVWTNVPRAVVSGLEGTFNTDLAPGLRWSNNLTWMIQSKNRSTGEQLSIIPEYTINSRIEWQANAALQLLGSVTWYGRQKPNKLDYQGLPVTGEETRSLAPYALIGVGMRYRLSRDLTLTTGIDNLFDKRLYRRGNAAGVNDPRTIFGAGAATYNEPGRSFYASLSARF